MTVTNRSLTDLRKQHPTFTYLGYEIDQEAWAHNQVALSWQFELANQAGDPLTFNPSMTFEVPSLTAFEPSQIAPLVFHIGLVEMLSYWKVACPPEIIIATGDSLNQAQIAWWTDLLKRGLGEFFYTNQIDFTAPDFVTFTVVNETDQPTKTPSTGITLNAQKLLLPLGGGKDSTVTSELLAATDYQVQPWGVNSIPAAQATANIAGLPPIKTIHRTLDPQLFELNSQGYLNGHTPFSALLAFTFTLIAVLSETKHVALANEWSANECNVTYKGWEINHQYSKSWEFEEKFRSYNATYVSEVNYFSLLRPLHELQIAALFALHPHHFRSFRSCNVGQKTNTWCHHCPKCMFVFSMLFPFLGEKTMTEEIFDHNLFEVKTVIPTALALIIQDETKPFECVGSYLETKAALWLAIAWYHQQKQPLPVVLAALEDELILPEPDKNWPETITQMLTDWQPNHNLPPDLAVVLKQAVQHISLPQIQRRTQHG